MTIMVQSQSNHTLLGGMCKFLVDINMWFPSVITQQEVHSVSSVWRDVLIVNSLELFWAALQDLKVTFIVFFFLLFFLHIMVMWLIIQITRGNVLQRTLLHFIRAAASISLLHNQSYFDSIKKNYWRTWF